MCHTRMQCDPCGLCPFKIRFQVPSGPDAELCFCVDDLQTTHHMIDNFCWNFVLCLARNTSSGCCAMTDDFVHVEIGPVVEAGKHGGDVISQLSRKFDDILPALSAGAYVREGYKEAAMGLRETITGVQHIVECFPLDRMTEHETESAVEGLRKVALGISRTATGLRALETSSRSTPLPGRVGVELAEPLEHMRARVEAERAVPKSSLLGVLDDIADRIHFFFKTSSSELLSAAVIALLLAALAAVAVLVAMLRMSPLIAVDAVLAALVVVIEVLSLV